MFTSAAFKAPRKAAVKMEKPEKPEGEKKSADRKAAADEDKDAKW